MVDYLGDHLFASDENKFFDIDEWVLSISYYHRIDLNERIEIAKGNNSKECFVYHYWYFNHGFKFQKSACKGCPDLLLCLNISAITVTTVIGADYRCFVHVISKSDAIHLLENFVLDDRG